MSEALGLGKIITTSQHRDSVHIAVCPVVAAETLFPGQHVGLTGGDHATGKGPSVGIVDPFLTTRVKPGERFWLYLYPGSVTSLRHVWEHPAFPEGT